MEDEEDDIPDNLDIFSENSYSHVKYVCKTDKLLKMTRVFITHKTNEMESNENMDTLEECDKPVASQSIAEETSTLI